MARPKKDKKAEAARLEAKAKRIADEKALQGETKVEPKKGMTIESRVKRLEHVISKLAHFTGRTRIISDAGMKQWEPGKRDMTRWRNEVKD